MTSTNDGKDVKSNQISGQKGKSYYIELYKSLEARLSSECVGEERTRLVCEAWRRVHSLCQHSAPTTHPHLLAWLQRHTSHTLLQTEWQSPKSKDQHGWLDEAIQAYIQECQEAASIREGPIPAWESQLLHRAQWFRNILSNPWGHPVLKALLDSSGIQPSDEEVLEWLKEERGVMFVTRLRQLAASKCDDLALLLASAVMERVRACTVPVSDVEQAEEPREKPQAPPVEATFASTLRREAGFTLDVSELLTDIELVLLYKGQSRSRCIELAKQTPLRDGYQLVERLHSRLEMSPRDKKLWKNAKDVATLVAQVVIARCMVVPTCSGAARVALYGCARSLVRLLSPEKLPTAASALAAPAATARHLHTLAAAVHAQCKAERKPFVCELYVRAITAGMNELERLKLKTEKEAEARSAEQTLSTWFTQLGGLLSDSARMSCECMLTAFSVHPTASMYECVKAAPPLAPVLKDFQEPNLESNSEFGSWATDSRTQTNFVKTSETLNLKQTQKHANVLSTAIFAEGEGLGLEAELCQDLAVLLSGPRVKTLSWDMDRELLLENCRIYMERTHGGTRALTTELKYLNLDPESFKHLPEEDDDDGDIYYGIEKGYEHLVEFQEPEEIWEDAVSDISDKSDYAFSIKNETTIAIPRRKKKSRRQLESSSEEERDPLSVAEKTQKTEKKERPHSKERSKERSKDKGKDKGQSKNKIKNKNKVKADSTIDPLSGISLDENTENTKKERKKEKKEKKERKKKEKTKLKQEFQPSNSLSRLVGMKVERLPQMSNPTQKLSDSNPIVNNHLCITDSDYDSQGKSSLASLNSEGNDPSVLFDGLYSMDEIKSPEKCLPGNIQRAISIAGNRTLSAPNLLRTNELNYNRQSQSPELFNTNMSPVSDDVKRSIKRLIEFRKNKNVSAQNSPGASDSDSRLSSPIPSQSPSTPKSVTDMSKILLNKQQARQLEAIKDEVSNILNNKGISVNKSMYSNNSLLHPNLSAKDDTRQSSLSTTQRPQNSQSVKNLKPKEETSYDSRYNDFIKQRPVLNTSPWSNKQQTTKDSFVSPSQLQFEEFIKQQSSQYTVKNQTVIKKESLAQNVTQQPVTKKPTKSKKVVSETSQLRKQRTPKQSSSRKVVLKETPSQKQYEIFLRELQESINAGISKDLPKAKTMPNKNNMHMQQNKVDIAHHSINASLSKDLPEIKIGTINASLSKDLPEIKMYSVGGKSKPVIQQKKMEHSQCGIDIGFNKDLPEVKIFTASDKSKMIQQRKVDNAPHTFSRLSYMHKSKQCDNKIKFNEPDSQNKLQQNVIGGQDLYSVEKVNRLQSRGDIVISKVDKPKCQTLIEGSKVIVQKVEDQNNFTSQILNNTTQTCTNLNKKYPLISNMLATNSHASSISRQEVIKDTKCFDKTDISKSNPMFTSLLKEEDQHDLLLLLRQQAKMNPPKSHLKTENKTHQTLNQMHSQLADSQRTIQHMPAQSSSVWSQDPNLNCQSQSVIKICSKSPKIHEIKNNNIEAPRTSPERNEIQKSKSNDPSQSDWESVMNALLAHKTPSRGPNALDIVLKKDSFEKRSNSIEHQTKKILHQHDNKVECLGKDSANIKQNVLKFTSSGSSLSKNCHSTIISQNLDNANIKPAVTKFTSCSSASSSKNYHSTIANQKQDTVIKDKVDYTSSAKKPDSGLPPKRYHGVIQNTNDPFISGIPNSDYDLLEELMDDDLRQEIGELSSDEEDFTVAPDSPKIKKVQTKDSINLQQGSKQTVTIYRKLQPVDTQQKLVQQTTTCQNTTSIIRPGIQTPVSASTSRVKDHHAKPKILSNEKVFPVPQRNKLVSNTESLNNNCQQPKIITPGVAVSASMVKKNFIVNNKIDTPNLQKTPASEEPVLNTAKGINVINHMNPNKSASNLNIVNPARVVLTVPPRNTTQNVMVIGTDLIYDPFSAIHVEKPKTNENVIGCNNNNAYISVEAAPSYTLFQTTQFVAPIVSPVIINNTLSVNNNVVPNICLNVPLDSKPKAVIITKKTSCKNENNISKTATTAISMQRDVTKSHVSILSSKVETNQVPESLVSIKDGVNLQNTSINVPMNEKVSSTSSFINVNINSETILRNTSLDTTKDIKTEKDTSVIKNSERKVFSLVQEKQTSLKKSELLNSLPEKSLCHKIPLKNNLPGNEIKERERLLKKRQLLISRKMIHSYNSRPIALTYEPIKSKPFAESELSIDNVHKLKDIQTNINICPENKSIDKNIIENTKENNLSDIDSNIDKTETNNLKTSVHKDMSESNALCRRILLRSSNILQNEKTIANETKTFKRIKRSKKITLDSSQNQREEVIPILNCGENKGKCIKSSTVLNSKSLESRKNEEKDITHIGCDLSSKNTIIKKETIQKAVTDFSETSTKLSENSLNRHCISPKFIHRNESSLCESTPSRININEKADINVNDTSVVCDSEEVIKKSRTVSQNAIKEKEKLPELGENSPKNKVNKCEIPQLGNQTSKTSSDVSSNHQSVSPLCKSTPSRVNINNKTDINVNDISDICDSEKIIKESEKFCPNVLKEIEQLPELSKNSSVNNINKCEISQLDNQTSKSSLDIPSTIKIIKKNELNEKEIPELSNVKNSIDADEVVEEDELRNKSYSLNMDKNKSSQNITSRKDCNKSNIDKKCTPIPLLWKNENNVKLQEVKSLENSKECYVVSDSQVDENKDKSIGKEKSKIVKEIPQNKHSREAVKGKVIVKKNDDKSEISTKQDRKAQLIKKYKDDIVFEEIPILDNVSSKRCIRIKLSNGNTFKATISGKIDINIESLLEEPTINDLLWKNINNSTKCTLNIKQVSVRTKNKCPKVNTEVQGISYPNKASGEPETINLISDDEDDAPSQSFQTEFGKFRVSFVDSDMLIKHQQKFSQKCVVTLERCPIVNNINTINNSKSEDATNLNNIIDVIEIDDSNESTDITKFDNLLKDLEIEPVLTENVDDLKSLLLKDFGVNTDINIKHIETPIDNNETIKTKKCFLKITKCDDLVKKYEQQRIQNQKLIKSCFVNLVKCDEDVIDDVLKPIQVTPEEELVLLNDALPVPSALQRRNSISILNDFQASGEGQSPRTSPSIIESPELKSFDFNEILTLTNLNNVLQINECSIKCDSDWFVTKKTLHLLHTSSKKYDYNDLCIEIKSNDIKDDDISTDCDSDLDCSLQTSFEDEISINTTLEYQVPTLSRILVDYFVRNNNILERLNASEKSVRQGVAQNSSPLKRKSTAADSKSRNKISKSDLCSSQFCRRSTKRLNDNSENNKPAKSNLRLKSEAITATSMFCGYKQIDGVVEGLNMDADNVVFSAVISDETVNPIDDSISVIDDNLKELSKDACDEEIKKISSEDCTHESVIKNILPEDKNTKYDEEKISVVFPSKMTLPYEVLMTDNEESVIIKDNTLSDENGITNKKMEVVKDYDSDKLLNPLTQNKVENETVATLTNRTSQFNDSLEYTVVSENNHRKENIIFNTDSVNKKAENETFICENDSLINSELEKSKDKLTNIDAVIESKISYNNELREKQVFHTSFSISTNCVINEIELTDEVKDHELEDRVEKNNDYNVEENTILCTDVTAGIDSSETKLTSFEMVEKFCKESESGKSKKSEQNIGLKSDVNDHKFEEERKSEANVDTFITEIVTNEKIEQEFCKEISNEINDDNQNKTSNIEEGMLCSSFLFQSETKYRETDVTISCDEVGSGQVMIKKCCNKKKCDDKEDDIQINSPSTDGTELNFEEKHTIESILIPKINESWPNSSTLFTRNTDENIVNDCYKDVNTFIRKDINQTHKSNVIESDMEENIKRMALGTDNVNDCETDAEIVSDLFEVTMAEKTEDDNQGKTSVTTINPRNSNDIISFPSAPVTEIVNSANILSHKVKISIDGKSCNEINGDQSDLGKVICNQKKDEKEIIIPVVEFRDDKLKEEKFCSVAIKDHKTKENILGNETNYLEKIVDDENTKHVVERDNCHMDQIQVFSSDIKSEIKDCEIDDDTYCRKSNNDKEIINNNQVNKPTDDVVMTNVVDRETNVKNYEYKINNDEKIIYDNQIETSSMEPKTSIKNCENENNFCKKRCSDQSAVTSCITANTHKESSIVLKNYNDRNHENDAKISSVLIEDKDIGIEIKVNTLSTNIVSVDSTTKKHENLDTDMSDGITCEAKETNKCNALNCEEDNEDVDIKQPVSGGTSCKSVKNENIFKCVQEDTLPTPESIDNLCLIDKTRDCHINKRDHDEFENSNNYPNKRKKEKENIVDENTTVNENYPQKNVTLVYNGDSNVILKGSIYEDPVVGTCYVFPILNKTNVTDEVSISNVCKNSTINAIQAIKSKLFENRLMIDDLYESDNYNNFNVFVPKMTYSRERFKTNIKVDKDIVDNTRKKNLKRKIDSNDHKFKEKKYRKGKNIDYSKILPCETSYSKEFKQLLKYCSSIKFSYSRPFHKDHIDVASLFKCWPISESNLDAVNCSEKEHRLFIDENFEMKEQFDPLQQTLAEEISTQYSESQLCDKIDESNFSMGFGEGSGRVIKFSEEGDISKFSAATLSDVKQPQPCLMSGDSENYEKRHELCKASKEQELCKASEDQIEIFKRYLSHVQLRDKVRSFFKKMTVELNYMWLKDNMDNKYRKAIINNKYYKSSFPYDLNSTDFIEPSPIESIVQVVQVGQLPVSAAAQNPVTCDPRVTQVTDASPSQCSAQNSPHDDSQSPIKTEYTELTTAELSLPLVQEYERQILESQEGLKILKNNENIPVETEVTSPEKNEDTEELTKLNEITDKCCENDNLQSLVNKHINNVEYSYDGQDNEGSIDNQSSTTITFEPLEKHNESEFITQTKQQNGSTEKTDQIAHAMNAAGITTTPESITNPRAQALVNILSQKICQDTPNSSNPTNLSKTNSINTMTLQQALAQILPPPLNQSNHTQDNHQSTPNSSVTSQVLHIVQGKNNNGNQITLVDNSQNSSVISNSNTPVLHIVQNKGASSNTTNNTNAPQHQNSYSGLSLVDAGLQNSNQLLHIVNTGNQKNNSTGQLLKRVNLLTNLTNVQGANEQKMVQFVCKSADGKSIQLNAPHQRSMVLRLQPIETSNIQSNTLKTTEGQDMSPSQNNITTNSNKETLNGQHEIKSRSVYEENYAKFIQSSSNKSLPEKSTSLPKFNQAFGKQVFQEGNQKVNDLNNGNSHLSSVQSNSENSDCTSSDNAMNLDHIGQINSPPLLLRKSPAQTSQSQSTQQNLVQQIKQTIAPMNIQTMHGGVIYTRQIPVNIGGGQTINLITVPSTELMDDSNQKQQSDVKFVSQGEMDQPIIKIVPQNQNSSNTEMTTEESNNHISISNENTSNVQPQHQPVLTQMRIKLPMLSKNPQMVSGARVVRPSFFQIQRNVIGGANQPVYQQLVLTAAPPLGQHTIRLPQTQTNRPVKTTSESQSSTESQMSSSTLEQLREFDMVLEQVKERSTVQPNSNSNNTFSNKLHTSSTDTTDSTCITSTVTESTQQVLYSIGNNQSLNVAYVNRKSNTATPTSATFARSPDSSGIIDSPSSSTHVPHTVTSENSGNDSTNHQNQQKPAKVGSKSKSRPKSSSNPPSSMKINTVPPKTTTQKPLEDEQTTQRILYILAEYKEQVENSPDKDKPAPRRRSNPPSNPSGSSKRKKSSSGSRRPGARDMSPVHGDETCRTMGSEDSSCGTSQGDCTESCLDSHSPQDSPRKVVRKLTFEQETATASQPRPQPQRNVIVADGQTITVARGTGGKPATAVLMPANYILPVSMVKGGQQIAIVTNRGPKLLTVGGGEGGATNALLLQRLIGPAGLKPVLARPGVRHVRLPTAALHNLQAFNLAAATTVQPPDSTASPAPAPTPPELVETRATSSPWTDRESQDVKPERGSSPEGSEPWNLPSSADPHDYTYEETVRTDNMDRTVLDAIPDRYSPDMEAQRIFDKMFDVDSKKSYIVDSQDDTSRCAYDIDPSDCDDKAYHQVVQKKDGTSQRQHRLTHVSAAALRHKYAILEHELRLQKSLSEECEDLGVDSPSASELFPEAELLFAASPAHDGAQHSHTPQPTMLNQSGIPQPDIDDQIATDQLLQQEVHEEQPDLDVTLGLDEGIVTVSEDGMQATIALDQEEFARSHPNTTFHSEPTDEGEVQPFTIAGLKGRHITSTIFHAGRAPATVLVTAPQTTVISQAAPETGIQNNQVKFANIDQIINSSPATHNNLNLSSVLVKDDGLTKFDNILTDSRELHLSNTASAIVHSTGNATQVIRRVCYEDDKRDTRFLMDEPDALIAGDDAKMIAEDSSRDATLESIAGDVDDGNSSPERHAELFWESNSASERSEGRRPLDFSSDSEKCCKSPSFDETNSTDSSGVGTHMRLDSVIKEARNIERSGSADGSSADDTHPPLRTYPAKRMYHSLEGEVERSMSGKTRAGERSPDLEVRRRASGRGVVKRGCHCCNGSPAPPKPKKSRQRKPTMDFTTN